MFARGEAHVVGLQRIGDDQVALPRRLRPERQIVRIIVGVVEEAALLRDDPARVGAGPAGIPAERALAGQLPVHLDRALHVGALVGFRHILIVDPPPAVRGDLVPGLQEGLHHRRIALHRQRDAEHGERNIVALEQPQQPPDAGARSIFVDLLHAHVPRARHRRRIGECRRGRPRRPDRRRGHWPRRLPHS